MHNKDGSITRILPVVTIQFLGNFIENTLRSSFIVLIAFSAVNALGIKNGALINLVNFFFVIPILLCSSYAGKIIDIYNKVSIIRVLTTYQLGVAVAISIGIYYNSEHLLLLLMLAIGLQLAFLHSIKFSILPQYLPANKVALATSYVEFSQFFAVLVGQMFGSWAMASHKTILIMIILIISGTFSVICSYMLKPVINTPKVTPIKFYKNPIKDSWLMFKQVTRSPQVSLNLHLIAWFWAFGAINTTQLSLFVVNYLNSDAHVYSIILGLDAIGIGIGSIICAKISHGKIKHQFVIMGAVVMSIITIIILLCHMTNNDTSSKISLIAFISSTSGLLLLTGIFLKSIFAGFYSLTCYAEIQALSKDTNRSQIMASITIISAIYVLITSIICGILETRFSSWSILVAAACINILFGIAYWKKTTSQKYKLIQE